MTPHRFAVILYQPEIPPNTGNIIRLCANTGCELHLVKPLGFPLEDSRLKRAGLDYHEYTNLVVHENWNNCKNYFNGRRIVAVETCTTTLYHKFDFLAQDVLLFGSETKGLPQNVLDEIGKDYIIRLPMLETQRSLNLSNSVAITVYEAWRQLGFNEGV
jgi:tRNA (cytidine/uridine-2'-O-)-methyltransferase